MGYYSVMTKFNQLPTPIITSETTRQIGERVMRVVELASEAPESVKKRDKVSPDYVSTGSTGDVEEVGFLPMNGHQDKLALDYDITNANLDDAIEPPRFVQRDISERE